MRLSAGYFSNSLTRECVPCSYCYPDHPGLTLPVKECSVRGQPVLYRCLPVIHAPVPHRGYDQASTQQPGVTGRGTELPMTARPGSRDRRAERRSRRERRRLLRRRRCRQDGGNPRRARTTTTAF